MAQNVIDRPSAIMKFVADLHLHSKYSRAVSQQMVLSQMAKWAKYKGINVIGTGDFTHPFWFEQLKNELEETGNGLLRLKSNDQKLKQNQALDVSPSALSQQDVSFLLSCEIASIYNQGGQTRRIHNLFLFRELSSVAKFNAELLKRGANLRSDGRPIVGLSSRDLVEIALESSDRVLIIPAHAWTPWFSVFGSFSGFDSLTECFADLTPYIYGIETGLSSDPAMNWQIGDLDNRAILSFSDAHSLEKMGREATVFEAEDMSYDSIYQAITGPAKESSKFPPEARLARLAAKQRAKGGKVQSAKLSGNPSTAATPHSSKTPKIAFTIEFYPEEGKYHFTGHRDCNFSQSPEATQKNGTKCPVCGRQLTIGVMHRVQQLKVRQSNFQVQNTGGIKWIYPQDHNRPPYVSQVPLMEIIAETVGAQVKTQKVTDFYFKLIFSLGSEFNVLLKANLDQISKFTNPQIAQSIDKVRRGDIVVEPGYDGKFGIVKIWPTSSQIPDQNQKETNQLNLFA